MPHRLRLRASASVVLGCLVGSVLVGASTGPASAGGPPDQKVTSRVSLTAAGAPLTGGDSTMPDISADGRWIVWGSWATNVIPGFHPTQRNIYLTDRATGKVTAGQRTGHGPPERQRERPPARQRQRPLRGLRLAGHQPRRQRRQHADRRLPP